MNTNIKTPNTALGHAVKFITFGLNKGEGHSRSQRKKANRREREKRKKYREERVQSRARAFKKEIVRGSQKDKLLVDRMALKKMRKDVKESALFLKTLKKIQKYYMNEDEHLDILFRILGYG